MKKMQFSKPTLQRYLHQISRNLNLILLCLGFSWASTSQSSPSMGPDRAEGEFIVMFRDPSSRLDNSTLEEKLGFKIITRLTPNIATIRRPIIEKAEWVIKTALEKPEVLLIEPNYLLQAFQAPTDPLFDLQWDLNNTGQSGGTPGLDIGMLRAWEIEKGSHDIVVAIIDTGILYSHPELQQNSWKNSLELNGELGRDDDGNGFIDDIHGFDFANFDSDPLDDQSHGSHIAGVIGAETNNGIGIAGINQRVSLMALKFLSNNGGGSLENAIRAIEYGTKMKASIMVAAWGMANYSDILKEVIEATGALFVAAAGSGAYNIDVNPVYPAAYDLPNVIAVAAVNNRGELTPSSNYGKKKIHIAAPGTNIQSITLNGYRAYSGTSMAASHVAGVAALTLAHEPELTTQALKERLSNTTLELPALKDKLVTGGIVHAYGALTNTKPSLP